MLQPVCRVEQWLPSPEKVSVPLVWLLPPPQIILVVDNDNGNDDVHVAAAAVAAGMGVNSFLTSINGGTVWRWAGECVTQRGLISITKQQAACTASTV